MQSGMHTCFDERTSWWYVEEGLCGARRIVSEGVVWSWEDMIAHFSAFMMDDGVGGGMHNVFVVHWCEYGLK